MKDELETVKESTPAELVRIEARALEALAERLDGSQRESFEAVASLLAMTARSNHRVVLTGIGKSGLIARKIAATFLSLGTAATFLHPAEALHGDLGLLNTGDVLLALSYSGETEELLRLLPVVPKLGVTLVSVTGCVASTLASASAHVLDVAVDVSQRLQFAPRDFAELHPGGNLGRRLATVRQLMHAGDALPVVSPSTAMPQLIHEMSAKRLGMTTVQANGMLLGVLSDGDLRRLLERNGPHAFHKTAADVMNAQPRTIPQEMLAADALALMEEHKITALVVTADGTAQTPVQGVVHLHDLWEVAPVKSR
jgi:arabinose-5-phosphate isomerase